MHLWKKRTRRMAMTKGAVRPKSGHSGQASTNDVLSRLFSSSWQKENSEQANLWARLFGCYYEQAVEARSRKAEPSSVESPWVSVSGRKYWYVQRGASVKIRGPRDERTARARSYDFLIRGEDAEFYVVEAKIQPAANPDTIRGHPWACVAAEFIGADSFGDLLGFCLKLQRKVIQDQWREERSKHKGEDKGSVARSFLDSLLRMRRDRDTASDFVLRLKGEEKPIGGFVLLLPNPTIEAANEWATLGARDVFSMTRLWRELPQPREYRKLQEWARQVF
jgi:hypothetical protein